MKSLLTFLVFNVVLLICCYEKKCAGSMTAGEPAESVETEGTFIVQFSEGEHNNQKSGALMQVVVDGGFIKGHVSSVSSAKKIEVVGAVNNRQEVVLIESANGEITRTFKGKFRKTGDHLCLLSGSWARIVNTGQRGFSAPPLLVNTVKSEAFSFSSK